MAFKRGTVTKATFEIEYEDGSTKTLELPEPNSIGHITFIDDYVTEEDKPSFNVSEDDWKLNPAMVAYPKDGLRGLPFCTHNGCK